MNAPRRRRLNPVMFLAALVAVVITTVWESRTREAAPAAPERVERPARVPEAVPAPPRAQNPAPPAATAPSGGGARLDAVVRSSDERAALERTLLLIERNGPFPYPGKDGSTFANREGLLPKKPRGYYREFTVPTAGASNRGARRVVAGSEGERWYTRDHYRTFTRVDGSAPVR